MLAQFLEAEMLAEDVCESSQDLNQEDITLGPCKRVCLGKGWKWEVDAAEFVENLDFAKKRQNAEALRNYCVDLMPKHCIQNCHFSTVPSELYPNIFKFLSPADLVNCSLDVCTVCWGLAFKLSRIADYSVFFNSIFFIWEKWLLYYSIWYMQVDCGFENLFIFTAVVCDHTCQETVYDTSNQLLVCTRSGRCFQQWISTSEEEVDPGHHQDDIAASDEAEPLTTAAQLKKADFWALIG